MSKGVGMVNQYVHNLVDNVDKPWLIEKIKKDETFFIINENAYKYIKNLENGIVDQYIYTYVNDYLYDLLLEKIRKQDRSRKVK